MRPEIIGYTLGFIDAEGSFSVSIKLQSDVAYGVRADPVFSITQREREPLEILAKVIGAGRIIKKPGQKHLWLFIIDNMKELRERLIPFLDRHTDMLLAKRKTYKIFREIVLRLARGEHRNLNGLREIIILAYKLSELNPKARRRKGLNQVLKIISSRAAERGEPPGGR